jgi:hypothetical protein
VGKIIAGIFGVVPNGCKLGRDSVSFLLEEYSGPCNIFANCYVGNLLN